MWVIFRYVGWRFLTNIDEVYHCIPRITLKIKNFAQIINVGKSHFVSQEFE